VKKNKNHLTLFSSYSNSILDIALSLLVIGVSILAIYGFYIAHLWFIKNISLLF